MADEERTLYTISTDLDPKGFQELDSALREILGALEKATPAITQSGDAFARLTNLITKVAQRSQDVTGFLFEIIQPLERIAKFEFPEMAIKQYAGMLGIIQQLHPALVTILNDLLRLREAPPIPAWRALVPITPAALPEAPAEALQPQRLEAIQKRVEAIGQAWEGVASRLEQVRQKSIELEQFTERLVSLVPKALPTGPTPAEPQFILPGLEPFVAQADRAAEQAQRVTEGLQEMAEASRLIRGPFADVAEQITQFQDQAGRLVQAIQPVLSSTERFALDLGQAGRVVQGVLPGMAEALQPILPGLETFRQNLAQVTGAVQETLPGFEGVRENVAGIGRVVQGTLPGLAAFFDELDRAGQAVQLVHPGMVEFVRAINRARQVQQGAQETTALFRNELVALKQSALDQIPTFRAMWEGLQSIFQGFQGIRDRIGEALSAFRQLPQAAQDLMSVAQAGQFAGRMTVEVSENLIRLGRSIRMAPIQILADQLRSIPQPVRVALAALGVFGSVIEQLGLRFRTIGSAIERFYQDQSGLVYIGGVVTAVLTGLVSVLTSLGPVMATAASAVVNLASAVGVLLLNALGGVRTALSTLIPPLAKVGQQVINLASHFRLLSSAAMALSRGMATIGQAGRTIINTGLSILNTLNPLRLLNNLLGGTFSIMVAIIGAQGFIGLTNAISQASRAILDFTKQMQGVEVTLAALMGGTKSAAEALSFVRREAVRTPFTIPELGEAVRFIHAWGLEVTRWFTTIGDTAAAVNKPIEQVIRAIGLIRAGAIGRGRLSLEFLGINLREIAGLRFDNMNRLQNSIEETLDLLQRHLDERFGGVMEARVKTLVGVMSNLKDALVILSDALARPIFEFFAANLQKLIDVFQANRVQITGFARALGELLVRAIQRAIRFIDGLLQALGLLGREGVAGAIARAMHNVAQSLLEPVEPIVIAAKKIADTLSGKQGPLRDLIDQAPELLGRYFRAFSEADISAVDQLARFAAERVGSLGEAVGEFAEEASMAVIGAAAKAIGEFGSIAQAGEAFWRDIATLFGEFLPDVQRYIDLLNQLAVAQSQVEAIQTGMVDAAEAWLEETTAAVRRVQDALSEFREEARFAPMFLRLGMERQLQRELRLRQEQERQARERLELARKQLEAARAQVEAVQKLVRAQEAHLSLLERMFALQERLQRQTPEEGFLRPEAPKFAEDIAAEQEAIAKATEKWRDRLVEILGPVETIFVNLGSLFKGTLGIATEGTDEWNRKGLELRKTLIELKDAAMGFIETLSQFARGFLIDPARIDETTGAIAGTTDKISDLSDAAQKGAQVRKFFDDLVWALNRIGEWWETLPPKARGFIAALFGLEVLTGLPSRSLALLAVVLGVVAKGLSLLGVTAVTAIRLLEELGSLINTLLLPAFTALGLTTLPPLMTMAALVGLFTVANDTITTTIKLLIWLSKTAYAAVLPLAAISKITVALQTGNWRALTQAVQEFWDASKKGIEALTQASDDLDHQLALVRLAVQQDRQDLQDFMLTIEKWGGRLGQTFDQISSGAEGLGEDINDVWGRLRGSEDLDRFIEETQDLFDDLNRELVQDSTVPEMVDGIIAEFRRLREETLALLEDLTGRIGQLFEDLVTRLQHLLVFNMGAIPERLGDVFRRMREETLDLLEDLTGRLGQLFENLTARLQRLLAIDVGTLSEKMVTALQLSPTLSAGLIPSLQRLAPAMEGIAATIPVAGVGAPIQATFTHYWDASISATDRARIRAEVKQATYESISEVLHR